jgi:O-antigen/teichoic acid export membrane protein
MKDFPNTQVPSEKDLSDSRNRWASHRRWFASWTLKVLEFGFAQALVQLFLALSGLLIVRGLSKAEYAIFAVANSMLTACDVLSDVGIGIGVRSIGGRVWNDRVRFGQLMKTALTLRYRFALGSLGLCLPITAWALLRNGASITATIQLCLLLVAGVVPFLGYSVWGKSAQLHGEYRRIQKLDLSNAILRTILIAGFRLIRLTALLAFLVGVITTWIQMVFTRRWAREKVEPDSTVNADDRRELIRLSKKALPNTVFFCFQGQITLFILTLLGNSTGVADITALGRIAAFFGVFTVMFANVLGPSFARCQDAKRLPRLYLLLVGGTVLILTPCVILAYLFPSVFLWLLGGRYGGLQNECVWVVAAASLAQIGVVMWNLNSGKAWILVQAHGFIPAILSAQALAAVFLNLRQFHDVIIFNLVVCAAPLPIYAVDAWIGLRTGLNTKRA